MTEILQDRHRSALLRGVHRSPDRESPSPIGRNHVLGQGTLPAFRVDALFASRFPYRRLHYWRIDRYTHVGERLIAATGTSPSPSGFLRNMARRGALEPGPEGEVTGWRACLTRGQDERT